MRRPHTSLIIAACLLLPPISASAEDVHTDTFSPGENTGNWRLSGNPTVDSSGGNPGHWLHNANAVTFAPIASSDASVSSPFSGDFRAAGVTHITFDARLISRGFGDPVGFEMSILLRDTKGTADVDDDDYVYYVGPQVPLMADGWKSYSFEVPSQSTDASPAGWTGGWVGDLENFRPGVDWNDVITNVDRVEIWWINPSFFAFLDDWDCGMDNIAIVTEEPVEEPCPGDANGDDAVNLTDLLAVISHWGSSDPAGDVDTSGTVDLVDLLSVISNWGSTCSDP